MKYLNDVTTKDCVGKILKSKNFGEFKVVKYNNKTNVVIQFLKTDYETTVRLTNIRNGYVKDPYSASVYDVGISGTKYPPTINDVKTKEYGLWQNMLTERTVPSDHQLLHSNDEGLYLCDHTKQCPYQTAYQQL